MMLFSTNLSHCEVYISSYYKFQEIHQIIRLKTWKLKATNKLIIFTFFSHRREKFPEKEKFAIYLPKKKHFYFNLIDSRKEEGSGRKKSYFPKGFPQK